MKSKSKVREIFLLTGEPKGIEFDPVFAVRNKLPDSIAETQVRINYSEHEDALTKLRNIDGINIIDPIAYLCQNKQCKTHNYIHNKQIIHINHNIAPSSIT